MDTSRPGHHGSCPDPWPFPLLDPLFGDHMTLECLDDVIVQFVGPRHHPVRIGIEVPLDEVVHVEQRDQLPCTSMYRRPTLWTTPNRSCSDSASTVWTAIRNRSAKSSNRV